MGWGWMGWFIGRGLKAGSRVGGFGARLGFVISLSEVAAAEIPISECERSGAPGNGKNKQRQRPMRGSFASAAKARPQAQDDGEKQTTARATAKVRLVEVLVSHVSDDEVVANMGHPAGIL
jgi:hypothetical protein